jgi:hypothetical protein
MKNNEKIKTSNRGTAISHQESRSSSAQGSQEAERQVAGSR